LVKQAGVKSVSGISVRHVHDYQVARKGDVSAATGRNDLFVVSGHLSFAVERGYAKNNVAKRVKKVKVAHTHPLFLSFEEWDKVKEVAEKTDLWTLVATAYYTGFRNSELCFLEWSESISCRVKSRGGLSRHLDFGHPLGYVSSLPPSGLQRLRARSGKGP
jgi:integrase